MAALYVVAAVLRVWYAVTHPELIAPDEQFQTLEPANFVVNGVGWLAWEWQVGARNWTVPALYMPLLWMLKQFGIAGGLLPLQLCRAFTAAVGALIPWRFHALLKQRGIDRRAAYFSVAVLALAPNCIAWSASTFSETWAGCAVWISIPWLTMLLSRADDASKRRGFFFAGVWLAAIVALRFQMGFWVIGAGISAVALCPPLRTAAGAKNAHATIAGFALGILLLGCLDWFNWGSFLHSPITYWRMNVTQNVSEIYGISPWYDYAPRLYADWGTLLSAVIFCIVVAAAVSRRLAFCAVDGLVLLPALSFFVLHSAVPHKEDRFLTPIYPAFIYVFALALNVLLPKAAILRPHLTTAMACAAAAALMMFYPWRRFSSFADLTHLTAAMASHGGLDRHPHRRVILLDEYWIWTRGEMVLGRKTTWSEVRFDELDKAPLQDAQYLLLNAGLEQRFLQRNDDNWQFLSRDAQDHTLFVRADSP